MLPAAGGPLALAIDAAPLGQRCTILHSRVGIRGSAIPVAWLIAPATATDARRPHWDALCNHRRDVTPVDGTGIVLAERGVSASWRLRTLADLGRLPFLRIKRQGLFRPAGRTGDQPLRQEIPKGSPAWRGRVTGFTTRERQIDGKLRARRDAAATAPWLMWTDRLPDAAESVWDGMRAGIEGSDQDATRGRWHGEPTNMTDPQRAERR